MQIMRQKQIIKRIINACQGKEEIRTDTDNKTHAPITTDVLLIQVKLRELKNQYEYLKTDWHILINGINSIIQT